MNKKKGIIFLILGIILLLVAFVAGQTGYATEIWLMLSALFTIIGVIGVICKRNFLLNSFAGVTLYLAILSHFLFGILLISLAFLVMFAVLICVTLNKNKKSSN